jgi:hypothetical protein
VSETVVSDEYALRCAIAVGPAGDPRLLYSRQRTPDTQNADVILVTRTPSGWVRAQVPLGNDVVSSFSATQLFRVFAPSATRTTILFQQFTSILQMPVRAIDRDGSTWSAVATVSSGGAVAPGGVAISADGSRLAFAYVDTFAPGDAMLAVRGDAGQWTSFAFFRPQFGTTLGFNDAGKLWVLSGLGQLPAERASYLLFEEK